MRIIMFHGVGGDDYPAAVFEAQLKYLAKHFSIVPLESILKKVTAPNSVPRHEVALTFDDGLRNHYTVVYPILQRLGIPATFFVCPGLIDIGCWIWNHEARERLQSLPPERQAALCRKLRAPVSGVEGIVEWMKSLAPNLRKPVEGAIRAITPDFKPSARQRDQYDVMTWKEIASIDPTLVTIGSHTVNHPILTGLSPDDLSYEIRESRRWLEERLQRLVEHFCYPDGAYNAAVLTCVRECYRSAVTSIPGSVEVGNDVHSLGRINTARQLPLLAWHMHRLAALAKSPHSDL
jgi:peptidoglycan/xylan/chitin deacetylase (PgdA/CDA1 family)